MQAAANASKEVMVQYAKGWSDLTKAKSGSGMMKIETRPVRSAAMNITKNISPTAIAHMSNLEMFITTFWRHGRMSAMGRKQTLVD